jgi:hypothetical protein
MQKTRTFALAAVLIATLAGCGGSDTYVRVQGTTTISKGQELTDLQRALKEGAINQREYDRLYAKILARPN